MIRAILFLIKKLKHLSGLKNLIFMTTYLRFVIGIIQNLKNNFFAKLIKLNFIIDLLFAVY